MKAESVLQIFKDIKGILESQNCLLQSQRNILTVEDLAVYAGITKGWIYKLTSAGLIPFYKSPTGKLIYFKRSEIDDWLFSKPSPATKTIAQIQKKLKKKKPNN